MSTIEINKIVGAILLSALLAMVIGIVGNALVSPKQHHGAAVHVPEASTVTAEAKPEKQVPFPQLLAAADPKKGAKIFNKCKSCHTAEKGGKNKIGPDLWNVVGRKRGSFPGFSYSSAMKEKGGSWTYETLNKFLTKPKDFVPGTKMTFAGLSKATDRAAVIAYLRTMSDSPKPLP